MKEKWYKKKILGDFAESICINHFDALGYHVEHTGIEKSASMFTKYLNHSVNKSIPAETIYQSIHQLPDLLISRLFENKLESFFIEVKYRNKVDDFKMLENQLLWQYRNEIWTSQIMNAVGFTHNEEGIWLSPASDLKQEILKKVTTYRQKHQFIKFPIIFYLVVKHTPNHEEHIYCNFATYPGWWNMGDNRFNGTGFTTYRSNNELNEYKNFNEVYIKEIKPALDSIFN